MLSIHDRPVRLCDGISRRELLRVGGLSALGLTLPALIESQARRAHAAAAATDGASFGRAKNVLFLWLQGGPPQHETFDPKPDAPAEIRGEFRPIQTNVPGIHFGELLPRTAARADKLAVVRSLRTHSDLHDGSGYWILTGYPYNGQQSRQISPTDWPYLGSVIKQLKPSEEAPAFSSVWLPDVMRLNDNVMPAGQTAGFLGPAWEPHRLVCDPSAADFHIEGLALPDDVPPLRLSARESLLAQLNRHTALLERQAAVKSYTSHTAEALGLLLSGAGREAFDLNREPAALRDRYGRNKWGQSLILARRLIEAGARLVHVNWLRDPGDEAVNNPMWDTHAQNADRLQDVLCPIFDVGFTALLDDLEARGLLQETLVVAIGEFGRTPKINQQGGRDHWGHVFSFALAGAGVSGGQVYGASDRQGGYPREDALEPQELTATIVHLLGIDHRATFTDASGRPYHVTKGEPLYKLLGDRPATEARTTPTGNLALVPGYTRDYLLNRGFEDGVPLVAAGSGKRLKGWQATPFSEGPSTGAMAPGATAVSAVRETASIPLSVRLLQGDSALPRSGTRHAAIGFDLTGSTIDGEIPADAAAMLTQEIRNPRAGTYTVTLHAALVGTPDGCAVFHEHFRCRLVLFGYTVLSKDPTQPRREFAALEFSPSAAESAAGYRPISVSYRFRSQEAGAGEIEMGVGVAVLVERKTSGPLPVAVGSRAELLVDDVDATFTPRPRDDNVMV